MKIFYMAKKKISIVKDKMKRITLTHFLCLSLSGLFYISVNCKTDSKASYSCPQKYKTFWPVECK